MNCAEFKEHVAAYALGALDEGERQACDEHLRLPRHEGCLEELGRMSSTAHSLAESLPPVKPGAHVWKRIEERIGREAEGREPSGGGRRWREVLAWSIAVAALIALWFLVRKKDELEQRVAEAESQRMLAQADSREQERLKSECRTELAKAAVGDVQRQVVAALEQQGTKLAALGPFPGAPGGFGGNIVVNKDQKLAYLVGNGFKPQAGTRYQLWVTPDGKAMIPAGFVEPAENGNAVATFDPKVLDQAKAAFAVSIEPENDPKPEAPDKPILLGAVPQGT